MSSRRSICGGSGRAGAQALELLLRLLQLPPLRLLLRFAFRDQTPDPRNESIAAASATSFCAHEGAQSSIAGGDCLSCSPFRVGRMPLYRLDR
jgi:hypothetical protein